MSKHHVRIKRMAAKLVERDKEDRNAGCRFCAGLTCVNAENGNQCRICGRTADIDALRQEQLEAHTALQHQSFSNDPQGQFFDFYANSATPTKERSIVPMEERQGPIFTIKQHKQAAPESSFRQKKKHRHFGKFELDYFQDEQHTDAVGDWNTMPKDPGMERHVRVWQGGLYCPDQKTEDENYAPPHALMYMDRNGQCLCKGEGCILCTKMTDVCGHCG